MNTEGGLIGTHQRLCVTEFALPARVCSQDNVQAPSGAGLSALHQGAEARVRQASLQAQGCPQHPQLPLAFAKPHRLLPPFAPGRLSPAPPRRPRGYKHLLPELNKR